MKKNKMKKLEKNTISKEKQANIKGQGGLVEICMACGAAAVNGVCSAACAGDDGDRTNLGIHEIAI